MRRATASASLSPSIPICEAPDRLRNSNSELSPLFYNWIQRTTPLLFRGHCEKYGDLLRGRGPRSLGRVPEVQGPLPNPLDARPGTKRGQSRTIFVGQIDQAQPLALGEVLHNDDKTAPGAYINGVALQAQTRGIQVTK